MSRASTRGYFVRERLLEAREARGITQADLAAALGKGASTISNWERGDQSPEPAMLEQLARALDVSPTYLLKPIPDHGASAIFFRSLSNATARIRAREKTRLRWLQHISLALQETLQFPDLAFPEIVERGAYRSMVEQDLEAVAAELRALWRLGEGPITQMVLVAENAGVIVGLDEIGSPAIDGQGNWSDADGRPYVLLAKDKYTAFRRQMDVAHEVAHLALHRGVDDATLERDFELIEWQAKYLASAFLMPGRAIAAELPSLSLDGFLALKPRWMVSVGAMIMRLQQLEILSEEAAQRLWKYRATRGWHRREPLDDPNETPVEEPRLLRRSIEMIVGSKVRTRQDLLYTDIGLSAQDVETLAALPTRYFFDDSKVVQLEPRLRPDAAQRASATVVKFPR